MTENIDPRTDPQFQALKHVMDEITQKLEALRAMIEAQHHQRLIDEGMNPELHQHDCRLKYGRKYVNVDVGTSGYYMVEMSTGNIYGIKAYGVIHRGHQYGTLDTIEDWYWGGYRAGPRASKRIGR